MSSYPQLEIVYFQVRARAETPNMIMAYGGIPSRTLSCEDYLGMSFSEAKKNEKLPFGQLPILRIGGEGGRVIAESGSINRYLASLVKASGFVPKDLVEQAFCDMIYEASQSLAKIQPICNVFRGDKFHEEKTDFFKNVLPSRLKALAKLLSDKQFFCGNDVTYCDFAVYNYFDLCRSVEAAVFADYPNVVQWMARVESLPGVKEYLANRAEMVDIGVSPALKPRN